MERLELSSQKLNSDGFANFAFYIDLPLTLFASDNAELLVPDPSALSKVS